LQARAAPLQKQGGIEHYRDRVAAFLSGPDTTRHLADKRRAHNGVQR
jgi:hypothetical protein